MNFSTDSSLSSVNSSPLTPIKLTTTTPTSSPTQSQFKLNTTTPPYSPSQLPSKQPTTTTPRPPSQTQSNQITATPPHSPSQPQSKKINLTPPHSPSQPHSKRITTTPPYSPPNYHPKDVHFLNQPQIDDNSAHSPPKRKKVKRTNKTQPVKGYTHAQSSLHALPSLEDLCDPAGNLPSQYVLETQSTTCTNFPAHLKHYKCSPCTGKLVGFICAFRYIRQWVCIRDSPRTYVGGPVFPAYITSPIQLGYRNPQFPTEFNRLPTQNDLNELRQLLATILLPAIEVEKKWWMDHNVKFVGRRIDLATKCDYCSATLIGAAWLCDQCGAEACLRCFEWMSLQAQNHDSSLNSPNKVAHIDWLKRLTTCTRLHQIGHGPNTHIRISHITLEELEALHQQMRILTAETPSIETDMSTSINSCPYSVPPDLDKYLFRPESGCSEPYIRISVEDLEADPSIFDRLWSTGQIILVTGMKNKLKLQWTPWFFARSRPHEKCQRIDSNSQTQVLVDTTVLEFFQDFEKDPSETNRVWKLRDWPSETDFQIKFPDLFHDFQQALPIPDITTRFGIRNVAAHFPQNANVPDIGPKMYIAMKNSDHAGSRGSTVLHMDVADAINIQTYAKVGNGEAEGCALWHLYHAKDSEKIRDFLYQHEAEALRMSVESVKANYDDPIHTTRTYIDANMRKILREKYGVTGWEVKQKPGEAILIPAYTAHQVCNLANCIKVAADFVSPHSIRRCLKLTEEFRLQNHERRKPWREDLLQINQMLLYAFQSTGRKLDEFRVREQFSIFESKNQPSVLQLDQQQ